MSAAVEATYRCTRCGLLWGYAAVRHVACCRECGSGLVRVGEREAAREARRASAARPAGALPRTSMLA